MRPTVSSNIFYLYLIKLSKWLLLIMPIVALYYKENGLSNFDIYLLQAVYSLSVAVFELPSGYMADMIGRKKSLVLGSVLGIIGYAIYSAGDGFYYFLVAEITLGLGGSCISGSDSALLYDSLAAENQSHRYLQYEGRITSLGNFAETAAAICGGAIAALISYRGVYIGQTIVAALALPASLLLIEPERKKLQGIARIQQLFSICSHALIQDKKLSATILISSAIGTSTLCMAWTAQVFFISNGLDELSITPLWVILNLTVALVAAVAHKTRKTLGYKFSLLLIIIYIPAGYILLGILPFFGGIAALLLFYAVRGYATPVLKDLTNTYCRSEIRATVLSIRSLLIRVSFSILGPLIGVLDRHYGFQEALIITGLGLFVASITSGIFLFTTVPEAFYPPLEKKPPQKNNKRQ